MTPLCVAPLFCRCCWAFSGNAPFPPFFRLLIGQRVLRGYIATWHVHDIAWQSTCVVWCGQDFLKYHQCVWGFWVFGFFLFNPEAEKKAFFEKPTSLDKALTSVFLIMSVKSHLLAALRTSSLPFLAFAILSLLYPLFTCSCLSLPISSRISTYSSSFLCASHGLLVFFSPPPCLRRVSSLSLFLSPSLSVNLPPSLLIFSSLPSLGLGI